MDDVKKIKEHLPICQSYSGLICKCQDYEDDKAISQLGHLVRPEMDEEGNWIVTAEFWGANGTD